MAHPEHVELVKRGAKAIDEWRGRDPKNVDAQFAMLLKRLRIYCEPKGGGK